MRFSLHIFHLSLPLPLLSPGTFFGSNLLFIFVLNSFFLLSLTGLQYSFGKDPTLLVLEMDAHVTHEQYAVIDSEKGI